MKRKGRFLVCDECDYCCLLHGPQAAALAAAPPPCPGCGEPTRVSRHEPWRERLRPAANE